MPDIIIPIALFGAAVLISGQFTRLLSNLSLNHTLREALRSDPSSVPTLADRLDARQPWADALIGWIFIALAAGIVLTSLFEDVQERRQMLQAAIIPLLIGIVVIAYVRWAKGDANQASATASARASRSGARRKAG